MKLSVITGGMVETNCYLLTDEEKSLTAVIDPGFQSGELTAALQKAGTISLVLLTHGHFDHISGADQIRRDTGAKICLCRPEEKFCSDPELNVSRLMTGYVMPPFQADILVSNGEQISFGNHRIKIIHTPGHTAGGCCYLTENVLFTGDTLMAGTCGRTDLPTGSYQQILDSLQTLYELPGDYRVLPGHGPETTLDRERQGNPYMKIRNSQHDFDD